MNLKEYLNTPIRRMIARNIALALVVGICLLFVMLHDSRRMYGETIMFSTMSTMGSVTLSHKEKIVVKNALAAAHEAIREVEKTCNIFDPKASFPNSTRPRRTNRSHAVIYCGTYSRRRGRSGWIRGAFST